MIYKILKKPGNYSELVKILVHEVLNSYEIGKNRNVVKVEHSQAKQLDCVFY